MNGDSTPDAPRIRMIPNTSSATIIGMSHHILRAHRKRISSPTIPSRETASLTRSLKVIGTLSALSGIVVIRYHLFSNQKRSHSQQIQAAVVKGIPGVGGRGHDRFAAQIERRV